MDCHSPHDPATVPPQNPQATPSGTRAAAVTEALRLCSCMKLDFPRRQDLARVCQHIGDWRSFVDQAEVHGLAPLAYEHLKAASVAPPAATLTALRALTLRHRRAHLIRIRSLKEFIAASATRDIRVIVLKGAALASMIYPHPELRPMRDLDVLVACRDAERARQVLVDLGFAAPRHHTGFMRDHHHLPNATRHSDGLLVSLEVHSDALSRDAPETITLDNLNAPPQSFDLAGTAALTLGHVDMLRHLCRHTFEPAREIKLGAVVDIFGYAAHFAEEIDWSGLATDYPWVINTLHCLGYLAQMPAALAARLSTPQVSPPTGLGRGIKPLSEVFAGAGNGSSLIRDLFYPSDWWMHVYYNVPPGRSLRWTRGVRHPLTLGRWLWRRLMAARHDRQSRG